MTEPSLVLPPVMNQPDFAGFGVTQPIRVPQSRWEMGSPDGIGLTSVPYSGLAPHSSLSQQLGGDSSQPRFPLAPGGAAPHLGHHDPFGYRYDDAGMPVSGGSNYQLPTDADQWALPTSPGRSPSKRSSRAKKADGKQPSFLIKLYEENPKYQHIIRWDPAGAVIVIERPEELCDDVLPLVYRQTRFASFSRQLNIYGWMRKITLRQMENGLSDPDASTWSHQTLRRDSTKEEILSIKRRVPPRPSQAQKNAERRQAEANLSLSSDSDHNSPPDAFQPQSLGTYDSRPILDFGVPTTAPLRQSIFTGGSPQPEPALRRLSMPSTLRPVNLGSPPGFNTNMPLRGSGPLSMAPLSSSVPSHSNMLQLGTGRIDPPRLATNTGLGGLWLPDDSRRESDPLLRGTNVVPSFRPEDGSTWGRRGFGTLGDGLRPTEIAPINPPTGSFLYSWPASAPADRGGLIAPQPRMPPALPNNASPPSPPSSYGATFTTTPVPSANRPLTTVSPGAYHSGSRLQQITEWMAPRSAPLSPPRASTRHERKQSLTHAPYSPPHSRAPLVPGGGPVRSVAGGRRETALTIDTGRPGSPDDGLPSASLSGHLELFGGELEPKAEALFGADLKRDDIEFVGSPSPSNTSI